MSDGYEYGFEATGEATGIMYVTGNPMMADVLKSARPDAVMYRRPAPAEGWEVVTSDE